MEMWKLQQLVNYKLNIKMNDLENFEWIGLNAVWGIWTWAMLSNSITWILGIVGAVTLIWFNIERALTARKQRAMFDKKLQENEENA
jgi:hypothetical protein